MSREAALSVTARLARKGGGFTFDVTLEAPPGITIVFGASGAGKSTLLSIIAGLEAPTEGFVKLGDDVWLDTSRGVAKPVEARRVAYVFQSLALFPHMTALENVAFGIDRRVAKEERARRALASLARFRAGHLEARVPRTFSGGEAQRVALARAFAMSPTVVLLDEPFSALDSDLRYEFVADLRTASRDLGVPVLHVTHDRAEARVLGDRAVRMEGGRIVARGRPEDVLGVQSQPPPAGRAGDEEVSREEA
jgi:molybdate transport system ATP-binding protein